MTENILILGGTKEAAALAQTLVAKHGSHAVTTSLAGRTKEPKPLAGRVRIGGFGGAQGLADYIRESGVTRLIDATHPFAKQISDNAQRAADITGITFEKHQRLPWQKRDGDRWIEVKDLAAARDILPSGARVLLAIGAQYLSQFAGRDDITCIARTVDGAPQSSPLPVATWITGTPSTDWQNEADLLRDYAITHIVCRNSGGEGAYAKIVAARKLCLPVIMIQR